MSGKVEKKKWYKQSFKSEWLLHPELKDWLEQDKENPKSSYCIYCKATLKNANKSMLIKHKTSTKHLRHLREAQSDGIGFPRKKKASLVIIS